MDRDQHRQKRSRLGCTEKTDTGQNEEDDDVHDESKQDDAISRDRLSATTLALRTFSLRDKQRPDHSTNQQRAGINPSLCPLNQPHNSTPPTGFLAHPSFHQNGAPSASFSFEQNRLRHRPLSPNARENKDTIENPFASGTAHTVTETQKSTSRSSSDCSRTGLSSVMLTGRTYQRLGDRSTVSTIPYPSIHPANHRKNSDFSRSPPECPSNHYTSPNRVSNAALIANRKRKRGWPALPPPAYIYTHTSNPNFNIFGGILLYPELCFALAANLPVDDLLSLYAISKDFHTIIDTRFATVILSQSARKCPESSQIFPFRCYKYLCRPDPAPRIPHPHPGKHAVGEIRKVPSFRWLKMVLFRENACREIMTIMAEDGVPLPSRCELALKRMWFVMDIPDNARRIGYLHAKKLVEDLDLYFMMCFFVKLELRFNDPVGLNRYYGLRKVVLAQRGLLPLLRALKRSALPTKYDIMKGWVTTKHKPSPEEEGLPLFNTPAHEIGKLRMEYWGKKLTHDTSGKACTYLLRPDQLVMREIIRRKMVFSKHFLRCLLWGYVDIVTLKNYPSRKWDRRVDKSVEDYDDDDDEYSGNGAIPSDEKDNLLDLGTEKPISILVTPRHPIEDSRERTRKEHAFLEECMRWFKEERQAYINPTEAAQPEA